MQFCIPSDRTGVLLHPFSEPFGSLFLVCVVDARALLP